MKNKFDLVYIILAGIFLLSIFVIIAKVLTLIFGLNVIVISALVALASLFAVVIVIFIDDLKPEDFEKKRYNESCCLSIKLVRQD